MFPGDLLDDHYVDPSNSIQMLSRSEVERRRKYIEQLDAILVKGEHHPLAQLSKDCLSNDPEHRPTAEVIVSTLEGLECEVEGCYSEFSKLDAKRQVVATKAFVMKDIEAREKDTKLVALNEKLKRLQRKLENTHKV